MRRLRRLKHLQRLKHLERLKNFAFITLYFRRFWQFAKNFWHDICCHRFSCFLAEKKNPPLACTDGGSSSINVKILFGYLSLFLTVSLQLLLRVFQRVILDYRPAQLVAVLFSQSDRQTIFSPPKADHYWVFSFPLSHYNKLSFFHLSPYFIFVIGQATYQHSCNSTDLGYDYQ